MANPIIRSVDDARAHFGGHSHLGPLIKACDTATTDSDKAEAMIRLGKEIDGATSNADVSALLEDAETLLMDSVVQKEMSNIED